MKTPTLIAALMLCFTLGVFGQDKATLAGFVQDQTGAVVPGAHVQIAQASTGFTRDVTTDERGAYVIAGLSVGTYQITVAKEGFTTSQRSGIVLNVGQRATLDIVLGVQ